jgi:beta-galactosidase
VSDTRKPARRQTKIVLTVDNDGLPLIADGSDFVLVIATITDDEGNVKRLTKDNILFTVEGEGQIIGNERIGANPRVTEWGTAPMLLRSTIKPGKIKVTATIYPNGATTAKSGTIEIESIAPLQALVFKDLPTSNINSAETAKPVPSQNDVEQLREELQKTKEELQQLKLKEVERDQDAFGEGKKK